MTDFTGQSSALLFPGQGSQTRDMRDVVERICPELADLACDVVGDDPFERIDDGTRYQQPAIFCASVAGWERLGRPDVEYVAGHSLGEFAALVAAGSLAVEDGLRLVALRGRLMDEAARADGDGGMLAVLGGEPGAAADIAHRHGLIVANDNSPTQVVLSGHRERLEEAVREASDRRMKAIRLAVSGAFHSPAMEPAVPEFRAALDDTNFEAPRRTVLCALTAEPFDDMRRRLAEGLTRPVRWHDTMLALQRRGVRRFVESGPGQVLAKLARRTLRGVEATSADELEAAHA